MVAELQEELDAMRQRLTLAEDGLIGNTDLLSQNEVDKAKIQEEVEANHQAYLSKMSVVDDKLKDIDEAKKELLDVMGPKFAELRTNAEAIVNDAKRHFAEQGNQIGSLDARSRR